MAWNEPGGNDKDPWGNKNQGPPELDEAFKDLSKKINKLFGGKGGGGQGDSGLGYTGLAVILLVAVILWGIMGVFKVDETERAVVFRFGQYEDNLGPGLQWRPAFIYSKEIVQVTNIQEYDAKGLMLTEDENIVEMPLVVQWKISAVKDYVLNVKTPNESLEHATDSALRHVLGSTTLESALSDGRAKIALEVKERVQTYLDNYGTGILVVNVNLNRAKPPKEVKEAFDDVIEAKEDRERYKNEAQSYANQKIPVARGQAQRVIEEAKAHKEKVVANARGDADRFIKLHEEYKKAPDVMRQRLYIDTMEKVLSNSSKVIVDVDSGNNMFYMPLDKITQGASQNMTLQLSPSDVNQIATKLSEKVQPSTPRRSGGR